MPQTPRLGRANKLTVRAPRVPLDLKVHSRTIGTNVAYSLTTADVSRSGLLLVWQHDEKVPFIVNTLLELTIDPLGRCLEKPVSCLGKVVRREEDSAVQGDTGTKLGVQIVQIDKSDQNIWEGCLGELEKRFGLELTVTSDEA
jgi:PilZ domain